MLQSIITSLSETKEPISDVLRRTLVFAYRLKNEQVRSWVEKELNGYPTSSELPPYRKAQGTAKGHFVGAWGNQILNHPLPSVILKPEHRAFATDITLSQPIASYEGNDGSKTYAMEWPGDMVALYQDKFFEDFALHRAFLEIPGSIIEGMVDTVRTRLLTFMLEIEAASPGEGDQAIAQIPPGTVDRLMSVVILGGQNVIGNVNEFKSATVITGDVGSLKDALRGLGVEADHLESLESALQDDGLLDVDRERQKTVGKKTLEWIGKAAKATGKKGLAVGGAVVEEAIKRAVFGYLGY